MLTTSGGGAERRCNSRATFEGVEHFRLVIANGKLPRKNGDFVVWFHLHGAGELHRLNRSARALVLQRVLQLTAELGARLLVVQRAGKVGGVVARGRVGFAPLASCISVVGSCAQLLSAKIRTCIITIYLLLKNVFQNLF